MHTKNLSTGCQFYFNLIKNVEKGLDADPWLAINFLLIVIRNKKYYECYQITSVDFYSEIVLQCFNYCKYCY